MTLVKDVFKRCIYKNQCDLTNCEIIILCFDTNSVSLHENLALLEFLEEKQK